MPVPTGRDYTVSNSASGYLRSSEKEQRTILQSWMASLTWRGEARHHRNQRSHAPDAQTRQNESQVPSCEHPYLGLQVTTRSPREESGAWDTMQKVPSDSSREWPWLWEGQRAAAKALCEGAQAWRCSVRDANSTKASFSRKLGSRATTEGPGTPKVLAAYRESPEGFRGSSLTTAGV